MPSPRRSRVLAWVLVGVVAASLCVFARTSHAQVDDLAAFTDDDSSSRGGDRALLSDWESRVYSQSEHAVSAFDSMRAQRPTDILPIPRKVTDFARSAPHPPRAILVFWTRDRLALNYYIDNSTYLAPRTPTLPSSETRRR